ncbi:MAG TPA: SRPBCC domain-containing protein, partial [Candidatus Saccharimonadales bacterium]|nr:SRPBCC domain-containing protein [Candidatus Saccharimonadales bacterium]
MRSIEQTYTIKAPIEKVWLALTDANTAEKWGAGPAKVEAEVGGDFSYWDGDIHGKFTKIEPNKLIEQDWYGHDHPDHKYKVTFEIKGDEEKTTVHF